MICTVTSDSTNSRTYTTKTRSAYKAALQFGRCESGEVVTISTKSGHIISEARYTQECNGRYYRTNV